MIRNCERNLYILLALNLHPGVHADPARAESQIVAQAEMNSPAMSRVPDGPRIAAPFAFLKFCHRHPHQCVPDNAELPPRAFNETNRAELAEINRAVNRDIRPRRDIPTIDRWELEPAEGDCEDYVLTKRSRLIDRGWPVWTLTPAIVTAPTGSHMVLIVSLTSGDYVLDSLTDVIRPWHEVDYRFISRQSPHEPRQWLSLQRASAPGSQEPSTSE
jgi:predicted transglutaminase-like cysteine proteinase